MLHILTYDLKRPEQNYQKLIAAIRSFDHIHVNGSCWIIRSNMLATQLRDIFSRSVDPSDDLIICDFHNWAGCNLPSNVSAWISR